MNSGPRDTASSLTALANAFRTDKGTTTPVCHAYTTVYDLLFNGWRYLPINLLEVGLSSGGPELGKPADRAVIDAPSIKMWHAYFPKGHIYGVDISDFSRFTEEWFSFYRLDCGNAQLLQEFIGTMMARDIQFDIVVDDGSHASYHQQLTLIKLFCAVRSGGLYIIEDLNWQPPEYEEMLPLVPKTVQQLQHFAGTGSFLASPAIPEAEWYYISDSIRNIIMLDDDQLFSMRRIYQRATGEKSFVPHYFDIPWPRRMLLRGYLRRIIGASQAFGRAVAAQPGPSQSSRVKLAIIHKF